MQGAIAGFDEIHLLAEQAADVDGVPAAGVPGVAEPGLVAPPVDTSLIEKSLSGVREVMATLFQPFKAAWAKEGANVINSVQYAFGSILALLGAIGTSLLEVWGEVGPSVIRHSCRSIAATLNVLGHLGESCYGYGSTAASTFSRAWFLLGAKYLSLPDISTQNLSLPL